MLLLLLSLPLPLLYFWLPSLKWFRKEQLTLGVVDQRSCLTMAILNASGKVTSPENMFTLHLSSHYVLEPPNKRNISDKITGGGIGWHHLGIGLKIASWELTYPLKNLCWRWFPFPKAGYSPTFPPPHLVPHFCGSASNRCLAGRGKFLHPHHARMPS